MIVAFAEPGAGDEEGVLGTDVPETADGVAVDPEGSFAEFADVEEGVAAGGGEGEVATVEGGGVGGHGCVGAAGDGLAARGVVAGLSFDRGSQARSDVEAGEGGQGRG